jgi:transcription elongation factor Elf1
MVIFGVGAVAGGYLLRIGRCPRCGHVFAVRAGRKARNNFTSACLTCGLRLDGSNAAASQPVGDEQ